MERGAYACCVQVTWSAVEAALHASVAGWRRRGRVWAGPCPVTGSGRDCCFFHRGPGDTVRGSCRRCHPLGRRGFAEHLEALAPGACAGAVGSAAFPGGVSLRSPSSGGWSAPGTDVCRPSRLWEAAEPLTGTAGERHLVAVRRVLPAGGWPPARVWAPARDAGIGRRQPVRGRRPGLRGRGQRAGDRSGRTGREAGVGAGRPVAVSVRGRGRLAGVRGGRLGGVHAGGMRRGSRGGSVSRWRPGRPACGCASGGDVVRAGPDGVGVGCAQWA